MTPELKKQILESKVEELPVVAIENLLVPALQKVVADTKNPVDDAIAAMVLPPLKVELEKLIAEFIAKFKAA
jgi:hypothetical protein